MRENKKSAEEYLAEAYEKSTGEEDSDWAPLEAIRAAQADHNQEMRDFMARVIQFNQEQISRVNDIEKKLEEMKLLKDGPWVPNQESSESKDQNSSSE